MNADPARVSRHLPPNLVGSNVLLVGEALGPGTQRLSGLPYIQLDGTMRATGKTLDAFLAGFGYTIDPTGPGRYAYSTDLVRCLPLVPPTQRVRPPTRQEMANCLPWLDEELRLVHPGVVILLGSRAVRAFFRTYLDRQVQDLAQVAGGPHRASILGIDMAVFAVHHPSPLAARPERVVLYRQVSRAIAQILEGDKPG